MVNHKYCLIIIVLLLSLLVCIPAYSRDSDSNFNKQFQEKYDAWVDAQNTWVNNHPLVSRLAEIKEQKDDLLTLGSRAIPLFIALFEEQLDNPTWDEQFKHDVVYCFKDITRKWFNETEYPKKQVGNMTLAMRLYVQWWNVGRAQTPEKYAELFSQWDTLDKLGKKNEAEKCVVAIADMGVEILPMVMQKIQDGDERLLPWIKRIMATRVEWKTADLATVLEWWEKNKENLAFPPVVVEESADETTK